MLRTDSTRFTMSSMRDLFASMASGKSASRIRRGQTERTGVFVPEIVLAFVEIEGRGVGNVNAIVLARKQIVDERLHGKNTQNAPGNARSAAEERSNPRLGPE